MKKNLLSLFFGCCLIGSMTSNAQTPLFTENFSSRALPAGWSNDSAGVSATDLWLFNNPYLRAITGAAFDTSFAIFDSDEGSVNNMIDENASLTTPDISLAALTGVPYLELDQQYRALGGPSTLGSARKIEFSTNAGATWTQIVYDSLDYGYPNPAIHSSYPISVGAATAIRFRFTWTGSWDWWWAIDNVVLNDYPIACTTPPTAGSTGGNTDTVCSSTNVTLFLLGADTAIGISYQWQISTDNTTWSDISGATASTYYFSGQTITSYYRCNVTCSGQSSPSTSWAVIQNDPLACYCIPPFTIGCDALNKVAVNTLITDSTDCNGNPNNYILYPTTGNYTTTLGTGDYYAFTIASGLGSGNHSAGVWFDFNADGDFQDPGEFYHISDSIPELSGDVTIIIGIPNSALLGLTRMRVRYVYFNPVTQGSDCNSYSYGETEDYTVNIVLGTSIKENPLNAISIHPVPAHDRIYIQSPILGAMSITLFDQTGRICKSIYSTTNSTEINTSEFAAGIYFVRFETEKNTITKKIVLN